MLVPEIEQRRDYIANLAEIDDPSALRGEFLRLKHTEAASLEFLAKVGVWNAVEDRNPPSWSQSMLMSGSFGYRYFNGRALPLTLEELWRQQSDWRSLLENPDALRSQFSTPPPSEATPHEKLKFSVNSLAFNTLQIHVAWQKQTRRQENGQKNTAVEPVAVLQTITGWEMLVATTHLDLLQRANFQRCQRSDCGIPFTGRERKYCSWYCGHIVSVRNGRVPKGRGKRKKNAKKR